MRECAILLPITYQTDNVLTVLKLQVLYFLFYVVVDNKSQCVAGKSFVCTALITNKLCLLQTTTPTYLQCVERTFFTN